MFGPVVDKANEEMQDLSKREMIVMAPLLACILWIGLYPKPILDRIETSTQALVKQVHNEVFGTTQVERPWQYRQTQRFPGYDDAHTTSRRGKTMRRLRCRG